VKERVKPKVSPKLR